MFSRRGSFHLLIIARVMFLVLMHTFLSYLDQKQSIPLAKKKHLFVTGVKM